MTLLITSYEPERNFSKLSVIIKRNKFRKIMLEKRLNFLFSLQQMITESLSYKEAIKEHAAKNVAEIIRCVTGS